MKKKGKKKKASKMEQTSKKPISITLLIDGKVIYRQANQLVEVSPLDKMKAALRETLFQA